MVLFSSRGEGDGSGRIGVPETGKRISAGNKRRVQVRKERKDAFNDAKKQIVLDHLAACCNVLAAAEAAGVAAETANYHRRNDPVFRAGLRRGDRRRLPDARRADARAG